MDRVVLKCAVFRDKFITRTDGMGQNTVASGVHIEEKNNFSCYVRHDSED